MAWLASLFQDGCDFSKLTGAMVSQIALNPDVPWLEVGIGAFREPRLDTKSGHWEVVYTGACYSYPETVPQDSYWTAAKAFDFLALVLGGGGTFFLWFSTCCIFSRATWRWAGYEVALAAFFQALSFLWFKTAMCHSSNSNCELFWGSKADIVSTVFWTVSALSIFVYYPIPKDREGGDGVWVDDNAPPRSTPTVSLGDNPLHLSEPTITTAAMTEISVGNGNSDMTAGMSSGESTSQDRERRDLEAKEMRDVELT